MTTCLPKNEIWPPSMGPVISQFVQMSAAVQPRVIVRFPIGLDFPLITLPFQHVLYRPVQNTSLGLFFLLRISNTVTKTVFHWKNIWYFPESHSKHVGEIVNYNRIFFHLSGHKSSVGVLDLQTFDYNSRPSNTLKPYSGFPQKSNNEFP